MTKKDFFITLIRGLALILLLVNIYQILVAIVYYYMSTPDGMMALFLVGSLLISLGVFYFLFVKTEKIVDFLRLAKGFDNEVFSLGKISESKLLQIIFVGMGVWMIVNNLPHFLSSLFFNFKNSIKQSNLETILEQFPPTQTSWYDFMVIALSIVIGFLLMKYGRFLSEKIFGTESSPD